MDGGEPLSIFGEDPPTRHYAPQIDIDSPLLAHSPYAAQMDCRLPWKTAPHYAAHPGIELPPLVHPLLCSSKKKFPSMP